MSHCENPTHAPSSSDPDRQREAGFTLVELLVVLVILGLIVGLVAPQAMKYLGTSRARAAHIQVERLATVLDLFHLDAGRYPTAEEGLPALLVRPPDLDGWAGPYIRKTAGLTDPWGKPYLYRHPGEHGEYDLYSLGADGRPGGTGQDADITSWQ